MANLEELLIRIDATTEGLRRELKRADQNVQQTTTGIEKAGKKIENAFAGIGKAAAAYLTFRTLKNLAVDAVQTSMKFDALEASMLAASGSAAEAQKNMQFLRSESERLGLVVLDSGKAFARLTAAARGTALEGDAVREVFTAISTAATVLRFNTEDTEGAIRAFEQMISKGKVSMEELRLQLGDRLPGALKLAAKAMNLSVIEFEALVQSGKLYTDEFLPKMAKVINDTFVDGLSVAAQSAQANMNRLNNSFNEFQDALGSSITQSVVYKESIIFLGDAFEYLSESMLGMLDSGGFVDVLLTDLTMSAYSLARAFGAVSEEDWGGVIAEGLRRTNQELGEFEKYLTNSERYEEKLKKFGFSIKTLDDSTISGIKSQIAFLKEVAKVPEHAADANKGIAELEKRLAGYSIKTGGASKETKKAQDALKKYRDELEMTVEQLDELNRLNLESKEAYELRRKEIEAENEARQKGLKIGTKEYEDTVRLIRQREIFKASIEDTNKAREEAVKRAEDEQKAYAEALNEPWQNAFENVQDALADMLAEGKYDFEALSNIAKKLAAEVAAAWVIRPILGSFIGGTGSGSLSATTALTGGGSQLGNLLSLGGSLFGGTGGGVASGALSAFDDIAADLFGTASSSAIGPFLPGTGTASSVLGSTFGGSYGGAIANLLGLGSGNFAIDTGTSLAGAALGNLIAPGVGGIIGSFAGTALGGLFGGGSRPHPAATVGVGGFSSSGGLLNSQLQAKHMSKEDAAQFAQSLGTVTAAMAAATGIDFRAFKAPEGGTAFQAGVNDGTGFFTFGSHKTDLGNKRVSVTFDPQNESDLNRAMGDLAKLFVMRAEDIGQEVNDTLLSVLDNIETEGRTVEEVISDIAFATGYDTLGQFPQQLSEVAVAVDELRKQFNLAAETSERLGLAVEKVRQYEQVRMTQLLGGYTQGIAQAILGATSPGILQTMNENARFAEQLRDLQLLGATQKEIQQAELLHEINLSIIAEQNSELQNEALETERKRYQTATDTARRFQSIQGSFENILHDLTLGKFSPLDPVSNLNAFRDRIQSLGMQAQLGDIDAAEELAKLLPEFVELSGQVNGFNTAFEADRQIAESLARATLSTAERQVQLQTSIANAANAQITVLQAGFASLEAALARFGGGLTTSDIIDSAQGLTGLTDAQKFATNYGRSKGFLGQNETATGGLLAGRLNPTQRAEFDSALKASGFAAGGLVRGTGGFDSINARLTDGEFVMRRSAVHRIGASNLAAMNSGAGTMNDVVRAIGKLSQISAASGEITAQQLSAMRASLDSLERNARLVAAS